MTAGRDNLHQQLRSTVRRPNRTLLVAIVAALGAWGLFAAVLVLR